MVISACEHFLSKLVLTKCIGMFSCFGETEPVYVPQLPMTVSTWPPTYHLLLPLHSVSYQGLTYATETRDFGLLRSDSPRLSKGNF